MGGGKLKKTHGPSLGAIQVLGQHHPVGCHRREVRSDLNTSSIRQPLGPCPQAEALTKKGLDKERGKGFSITRFFTSQLVPKGLEIMVLYGF